MSLRLRQAVFEEGRDVSEDGELRSIAHEFGIEPVDREAAAQRVAADWEKGRARSVRGSPHFFVGGRGWFCPTLRISHSGSDFEIVADSAALADFYAMALR